jgi:alanyl-tRNA synthetase
MVEMGGPWSRELCGGTHVKQSSQIGLLSLVGEHAVGSGVRRVEAFVSTDAFRHLARERALVANLTDLLKVQPDQLSDRIEKMLVQLKAAEKTIADMQAKEALAQAATLVDGARSVGGVRLVAAQVSAGGNDLRLLALDVRGRLGTEPAVVALVGGTTDKPSVVVATTEAARDRGVSAGRLVALAAAALGGKGGGKDDLAQGGGTDGTATPAALAAVASALGG